MKPRWDDRSRLLSDVFHELCQPLTGLHFSLELAAQQGGMVDEQVRQSLQLAEELRRRIISLQQLLTESLPKRSRSVAGLGETMIRVLAELAPIAAEEEILLRSSIPKRMLVKADGEQLREALFCLVEALLALTGEGGSASIMAQRTPSHWLLRIRTSPKDVAHGRCDRDKVHKNLDARLNLAIARKMIVATGAEVDMQREAGGSVTRISFPAAKAGLRRGTR